MAGPIGAQAQEPPADAAVDQYRDLTSVAPRRNCTTGGSSDEIVVCGGRRDSQRHRLPPSEPTPGSREEQSVGGERFALQQYRIEGGSGSCSTVGPNGASGCLTQKFREAEESSGGRKPRLAVRR